MTWLTHELAAEVGCTYRQLDFWCRRGYIPEPPRAPHRRGGQARRFGPDGAEIAWALARSSAIGSSAVDGPEIPAAVAAAVRTRRVNPAGEWLVVTAAGAARRHDHLCLDDATAFDAARVIRLRSFTAADQLVAGEQAAPPPVTSAPASAPGDDGSPATNPDGCQLCSDRTMFIYAGGRRRCATHHIPNARLYADEVLDQDEALADLEDHRLAMVGERP